MGPYRKNRPPILERSLRMGMGALVVVVGFGAALGCTRGNPDAFPGCRQGPLPQGALRLPNGRVVFPAGVQQAVDGYPQGLALSPDGKILVASLDGLGKVSSHSIFVMDTSTGAGSYLTFPTLFYGVAVSPDGTRAYVSGGGADTVYVVGLGGGSATHLGSIPVAGFPVGLTVSPTGEVLAACSGDDSVKVVDPNLMTVTATLPVGASPWGIAGDSTGEKFYVSNRGDGSVSVILARVGPIKTVKLRSNDQPFALAVSPSRGPVYVATADSDSLGLIDGGADLLDAVYGIGSAPDGVPGSIPSALALNADGTRLYVALSGENAVSVYSVPDMTLVGKIPTGWDPTALALSPDGGTLYVANAKGRSQSTWFPEMTGSISVVSVPDDAGLSQGIDRVARNNCLGAFPGAASPGMSYVRYVVVIEREGKTYDSLLGDLGPHAYGDPARVLYPAGVTPNAHALAVGYALAPFFFADGEAAPQNRHWRVSAYAGDFLERIWPYSAGGNAQPPYYLDPLALSPAGTIFDAALRVGLPVRVYGDPYPVLSTITSSTYNGAGFTDVDRAAVFITDLTKTFVPTASLPRLIYIYLPPQCSNPLTSCTQDPSYVHGEDVATGMIVQSLSWTPYWGNMAVFLVETSPPSDADDSRDGHRTGCILIGPFARSGYVSAARYSLPSLLRTIETLLGLPPMTQFDGNAPVMGDLFTGAFSPGPFTAVTQ